ncbi:MAG: ATP-grasp domain-containing protein, partial [Parafannyhessea umbonata]|uniref:carboxylate--amine ligase n=1 Tax=Parafannyhessea umbonata TaxID=604330 RepID=UPI0026ED6D23
MQTGPNATRSDIVPVVIGGDIGAYALCREFHQAFGVRAIALNTGFIGAIEHSRIIEPRTVASLEPKDVVPAVSAIAQTSEGRRVLLVGNTDQLIELLEDIAAQLPKNVTCLCPPRDAFEAVCDKATFSRLCREHGLDVPAMDVVHLAGTDLIAPTQIAFPVVAKPAVSADDYHLIVQGFKKVYYMTEQSQLDALWAELRAAGFAGDFLVQELIGGDDTYMDSLTIYIGRDGKPLMLGGAQVLLEDHAPAMLGNPVAMITRQNPEQWQKAAAMLSDAGYRGFANFDIKRDPKTGRELFLDCNPRIGRNSFYNLAGGVNPMEVAVLDLVDGRGEEPRVVADTILYT